MDEIDELLGISELLNDLKFTEWLIEKIELYPYKYRKFSRQKLIAIKEVIESKLEKARELKEALGKV